MKQKTILFFSCEPGGAEVLIPVIRLLEAETAYRIIVLSYGLGAERFSRKGIGYVEINRVGKNERSLFNSHQPALLITSATSLPDRDMSEKHLWQTAEQLGIPSLVFLDQWQNYAIRFSGPATNEHLTYLPNHINCIDEIGKREMTALGFAPEKLLTLGHPYLSAIRDEFDKINTDNIIPQLGLPANQKVALFVSEPILEYYGRTRGYDQYQAFAMFLEAMRDRLGGWRPLLKLHPKDQSSEFDKVIRAYPQLTPLVISNQMNSLECLKIADLVVGMTSIMLIESFVLGNKVVSLQPDLQVEDPLVLTRHALIPKATTPEELNRSDSDTFTKKRGIHIKFDREAFFRFLHITLSE